MKYIQFIQGTESNIVSMELIKEIDTQKMAEGLNSDTLNFNIYKFKMNDGSIFQWQCSEIMSNNFLTWLSSHVQTNLFIVNIN